MPEALVQEKSGSRSMAGARNSSISRSRVRKPKPLVPSWMKKAAKEFGKDVMYGSNRKR